jgi:RimJ/RimL family protein N-acetyltransferase
LTLPDGRRIPYRPIRPDDLEALHRFHAGLSDQSVYFRFMRPLPRLSEAQARRFTHLEDPGRLALVALDPEELSEIIAVIRFDREPGTDRAEYAAVVTDRWQGIGLGTGLTLRLVDAARAQGIRSFYAIVLPENRRMLSLLHDLALPEAVSYEDGVKYIEVMLDGVGGRQ